ncbi:uncharacterized protein LOC135203746 [Macrobrachium nipponense]|uniref:uncharacterized protein LOC135203746 n=1 Tax=Macrobrachium nipponense TaxID=159736 RepID=UPI0030C82080
MMSRLAFVVTASLCLGLLLFTPSAEAQQEVHAVQQNPQSQGFLERIMTDYVYPIRDYDWRGMVRRLLNGVMDYLAPDAKEPKVGGPYGHPAQERTGAFVRSVLSRAVHYVESLLD